MDLVHMSHYRHPDSTQTCHETVCPEWMDSAHVRACHGCWKGKKWVGKELCPFMNCTRMQNQEHVLEVLHVHFELCSLEREKGAGKCQIIDPDHMDTCFHAASKRQMS